MKARHNLAKEHFTPIVRTIGLPGSPIKTILDLRIKLREERERMNNDGVVLNQPTDALIIHGDGNLVINDDEEIVGGFNPMNPMKLILVGAKLVKEPSNAPDGRLIDNIRASKKWKFAPKAVDTVEAAQNFRESLRDWTSCRRYHTLFSLPPASVQSRVNL
jgi:hypothetical protein